jgi:ribosomal protein S20
MSVIAGVRFSEHLQQGDVKAEEREARALTPLIASAAKQPVIASPAGAKQPSRAVSAQIV